jgi:hypothetical protein
MRATRSASARNWSAHSDGRVPLVGSAGRGDPNPRAWALSRQVPKASATAQNAREKPMREERMNRNGSVGLDQLRNAFVKRHHNTPFESLLASRSHQYRVSCWSQILFLSIFTTASVAHHSACRAQRTLSSRLHLLPWGRPGKLSRRGFVDYAERTKPQQGFLPALHPSRTAVLSPPGAGLKGSDPAGKLYGRALGLEGDGAGSPESTAMAERNTSLVKKNFPSFGTIMICTLSESR